jgi:tetratricopeptide (TPR) repeat protein
MRTMMTKSFAALAALVVVAAATPAAAVQAAAPGHEAVDRPSPARAEQLSAQAQQLLSEPRQWRRAARMLEQSAQLRPASDEQAYVVLVQAARIRMAVGDLTTAREDLKKAATHALDRGAVLDAAHALLDAAAVAVEEKQAEEAAQLAGRATLLAQSPLISEAQRVSILRRI